MIGYIVASHLQIMGNKYIQKSYRKKRKELMNILGGPKCSNPNCLVPGGCRDERCLQFDHINGGGVKSLKGTGPINVYNYYIKYPELARKELQILCANCNWIKRAENNENPKERVKVNDQIKSENTYLNQAINPIHA